MVLVIDNYDSFTYNLVQHLKNLKATIKVYRNDKIDIKKIENLNPKHIIISPGPGRPSEAGISKEIIKQFKETIPILGVCLGHQAIAEVFGGKIITAKRLMHGKTSTVIADGKGVYKDIKSPFSAMRYHSLSIDEKSLHKDLIITARAEDGEIMGIRHKKYPLEGVQFHPESILTQYGGKILQNFINETFA